MSNSNVNSYSRETPLGIVQTNKVVQVYNERNTKYTFKVTDPTNSNSVINLVVVDMSGDIIEYFIQYIFDPNISVPRLSSGAIDMSRFTGGMTFYDMEGIIIGNFVLNDGDLVDSDGEIDPCPEDEVVEEEEDDTDDSSNSTSGGGGSNQTSDPNNNNSSDTDSSDSSGGGGYIDNPDEPCGMDWSYGACGCPTGPNDGHAITGNDCCSGSPLVVTNTCTGQTWSSAARIIEGGTSPCDGPVGVLIDEEQLIYDESLDEKPCQREIISDASSSCSPLNQVLLSIFESDNSVNLIFKSSNSIGPENANTSPISDCDSSGVCNITITFRESYLDTASDLAIAGTTIHESMHAILVRMFENGELLSPDGDPLEGYKDLVEAYIDALSGLPANLGVPHHELLGEFIDDMATALSIYDENSQSFNYYKKLSWSGLTTTDIFLAQYPAYLNPQDALNNPTNYNTEYLEIKLIIQAESFNTTQTFIHPNGNTYEFNPKGYTPNETAPCN